MTDKYCNQIGMIPIPFLTNIPVGQKVNKRFLFLNICLVAVLYGTACAPYFASLDQKQVKVDYPKYTQTFSLRQESMS